MCKPPVASRLILKLERAVEQSRNRLSSKLEKGGSNVASTYSILIIGDGTALPDCYFHIRDERTAPMARGRCLIPAPSASAWVGEFCAGVPVKLGLVV